MELTSKVLQFLGHILFKFAVWIVDHQTESHVIFQVLKILDYVVANYNLVLAAILLCLELGSL